MPCSSQVINKTETKKTAPSRIKSKQLKGRKAFGAGKRNSNAPNGRRSQSHRDIDRDSDVEEELEAYEFGSGDDEDGAEAIPLAEHKSPEPESIPKKRKQTDERVKDFLSQLFSSKKKRAAAAAAAAAAVATEVLVDAKPVSKMAHKDAPNSDEAEDDNEDDEDDEDQDDRVMPDSVEDGEPSAVSELGDEKQREKSILEAILSGDLTKLGNDDDDDNDKPDLSGLSHRERKKARREADDVIVPKEAQERLGKYVAIDCEMVGVGEDGVQSVLARISMVNFHGHCIYDKYVKPQERVTDYRTAVSGITPELLKTATPFKQVQKEVSDLIKDRIVVGHAIENDFKVLLLDHPRRLIRDTSQYKKFRKMFGGRSPALRKLAKQLLGLDIQEGAHSSVEDARVTMLLYKLEKDAWEKEAMRKFGSGKDKK
ncbi:ribonuclease H-like domain-containing protein [Polychytrium aggregatum]|uniref:ribonuclease H-like domain-containing protein n=1 Tax=Polychytrium aggregatum TaxID=110093 RepID=UPI0022FDEF56|nr:ribonuclease H-like domain-containing protein [Polychytrium aggregatum]KAI9190806.1 ribonuclease H-like domain-containing protein [Polychytrium aggregatum]